MTITVRQEHIDAARHPDPGELHCGKCPVWQAAEEAGIKGIRNVTPNRILRHHPLPSLLLTSAITNWILRFDAGKPVEPFSFEVEYV